MHKFSKSSIEKLEKLHPDLRKVVYRALELSRRDFGVSETLRTVQRQKEMVASGKSQTMHSRHIPGENESGECEAVDIYAYVGKVTYEPKYYRSIAKAMFEASFELGIEIEWGGMWESLNDMPHYQLKRK